MKSTKKAIPWKIVYRENFDTRKDATVREGKMKSWKSRKAIERLIKKMSNI